MYKHNSFSCSFVLILCMILEALELRPTDFSWNPILDVSDIFFRINDFNVLVSCRSFLRLWVSGMNSHIPRSNSFVFLGIPILEALFPNMQWKSPRQTFARLNWLLSGVLACRFTLATDRNGGLSSTDDDLALDSDRASRSVSFPWVHVHHTRGRQQVWCW